jgi:hypothetical protein
LIWPSTRAEPCHHDWPPDLNDNRLATEERLRAPRALKESGGLKRVYCEEYDNFLSEGDAPESN